jgi:uncharacterized damage-inducible protein DinB
MGDGSGSENGMRAGGVVEPAHEGDERTTLVGFLERQRTLIAWKLSEASDEVLRSVSTPSGMTIPGMVRHLENVDRYWFRQIFAGEKDLTFDWTDEDPDGEWKVPAGVPISEVLANYLAEGERCDAVIRAAPSLDEQAAGDPVSLRWIVNHMIEETARHLGQLDLLREQADGAVGEDPG